MFKKILLIFVFLFLSFSTSFADWKTDIDKGDYKLFSEVYPDKQDIYEFQSVKLNDKGEFVIEYTKDHYDKLLKVYGGRNMLIFDPKNTKKYKFNTKTEFKGDSVFITILKDEKLDLAYDAKIEDHCIYSFDVFTNYSWCNWSHNFVGNSIDDGKVLNFIKKGKYKKINIFFSKYFIKEGGGFNNGKIILENRDILNNINYKFLKEKYKNIIFKSPYNESVLLKFDTKNINKIMEYLKDIFYFEHLEFLLKDSIKNSETILIVSNNNLFLKGKKIKKINIRFEKNTKYDILSCSKNTNECLIDNFNNDDIKINIDFEKYKHKNYFNISKLINDLQEKGYLKGYGIKDIYRIGFSKKYFSFEFGDLDKDFLPITNKIKSPKNVSINPYLVSVNFILALLYLLAFYFTTQLFNSYFEELASKSKLNEKIGNFTTKFLKLPFQKLYNYLITISKKKKNKKLKGYLNKIKDFLIKHEHHIYIILGFLLLGIIGQIVVDDFDILSLKGWFTIFIMMFILAFITVFKDLLLYLFNKKESKSKLKLENMPLGFIFAGIVAVFGRWIGLIPGVMFGSVIKLNPKDSITERKTTKPKLLFKVLLIVFIVGLSCWMLTILFDSQSFIYKFLIVTYFGLINDVFFALLPFGMLWGIFILKDKKLKVKWFLLTFVIFFFLLHTIMNSDGDLNKLLQFDGNFAILVIILIFWMIITGGLYYKTKKIK